MTQPRHTAATVPFTPPPRVPPPAYPTAEVAVAAPPQPSGFTRTGWAARLLPVLMAAITAGMMAAVWHSGSGAGRHPMFLVFPTMMLISAVIAAVTGRDDRARRINVARSDYLIYLSGLRQSAAQTAAAQQAALLWCHPDPETLWTMAGSSRMWERRPADPDFCDVRVGAGARPLATPLVPPEFAPADRTDPVTITALQGFIRAHTTIAEAPIAIALRGLAAVSIEGDPAHTRGLLRSIVCQLAVFQAPDRLLIAAVISGRNQSYWEWLKWLPHNKHPNVADALGSSRMVYPTFREARTALAGVLDRTPVFTPDGEHLPQVAIIVDGDVGNGTERAMPAQIAGATILEISYGSNVLTAGAAVRLQLSASGLVLRCADNETLLARPDQIDVTAALMCARRLAPYRIAEPVMGGASYPDRGARWQDLVGIADPNSFDPEALWHSRRHRDRLCVPVGTTASGAPVELDIKEAAENGIGPHGLCIGATGSGKSEFLRTVALGMMARHSPELLNLVLIDFKGGATFRGLEHAPHVAALITNLADEAALVERMKDALAGEMNRRQELLRAAGNVVSVAAYEKARRAGAELAALPVLLIIVDEFSELLAQQPDFVDTFGAIGRLGRSLGMHLLLASQRLDEGRLRGLESHLSYRVCLKTLTANESRLVLGTPDAYQLANAPGAAFLRSAADDLTRFQTAFVSALCTPATAPPVAHCEDSVPPVRVFSAARAGALTLAAPAHADSAGGQTILQTVVQRLAGCGPPAHEVWLPPLAASPALSAVLRDAPPGIGGLTVPIGIVDRPFEQRRTPLTVDLAGAAGNVAVVGAPQSGKSTALRTLVTALAVANDPRRVQFYCLDFGGEALASLRHLPHTGSIAGRAEPDLVVRTISQFESIIRRRERFFRDHGVESMSDYRRLGSERGTHGDTLSDVFLVVDGWAALRQHFDALEAPITALAVQGLSFGVHLMLSAARWAELRPALKDAISTRIELRLGDAAESELDRKQAQRIPKDSAGRGLSADGHHMVIAVPRLDGIDSATGLAEVAAGLGQTLRHRYGDIAAPPLRLLPAHVDHRLVVERGASQPCGALLFGLEEHELRPIAVDLARHSHLLVLGEHECGKTTTLRTLCREIVRTNTPGQAQLLLVDFRRALLGVVQTEYLGGYAISAATLSAMLPGLVDVLRRRMPPPQASPEQLRARSWWSGPDIYIVVDDYDLVANATGNPLAVLVEYLPYATDLGLHLIVARRSAGAARALFEPLLASLRDLGAVGLVMSGSPDEGPLVGSVRPRPLPPGRGTMVTRNGAEQLIQVGWTATP